MVQNIAAKFNPLNRVQKRHRRQTIETGGHICDDERRLKSRAESGGWGSWGARQQVLRPQPPPAGESGECF